MTQWLTDHMLVADKSGSRVAWLTRRRAFARFMSAPFRTRDLFAHLDTE